MPASRMFRAGRPGLLLEARTRARAAARLIPATRLRYKMAAAPRPGPRPRAAVPYLSATSDRCGSHTAAPQRRSTQSHEPAGALSRLPLTKDCARRLLAVGGVESLAAAAQR